MRTLEQHTLLYDKDCPLCKVYTSGFIKSGMLDKNGRKPFSTISRKQQAYVDMDRASDEIALINTKDNTVIYGIDSLLKVLGYRFPFIEKIGHLFPVKFILKKCYSLISYNRKVIVPSPHNKSTELQCLPSFNITYRSIFILLTTVITALSLSFISKNQLLFPELASFTIALIALGQLIFQGIFIYKLKYTTIIDYFGNLMTITVVGSLAAIAIHYICWLFSLHQAIAFIGFSSAAIIMFVEHFRRLRLLQLPVYLCYTWIVYYLLMSTLI